MVPVQSTEKLGATLFGKTRRALLAVLFGHPDESFYLRQLARTTGVGMGALQRELRQLTAAGIITRDAVGRRAFFRANPGCPVFPELRDIVVKTFGVADVLRQALAPLARRIQTAFLFGSVVRGEFHRDSDVDVMLIGNLTPAEAAAALAPAQERLSREVRAVVFRPEVFKACVAEGRRLLASILKSPKIVIIGELRGLGIPEGQGPGPPARRKRPRRQPAAR